jgi:hypothetical protein
MGPFQDARIPKMRCNFKDLNLKSQFYYGQCFSSSQRAHKKSAPFGGAFKQQTYKPKSLYRVPAAIFKLREEMYFFFLIR